jgi:flagellar motor protein MotB
MLRRMKHLYFFLLLLVLSLSSFALEKPGVYLLSKKEFKELETNGKLVETAIKYVFGANRENNEYQFSIKKVDAWSSKVPEFRYFPETEMDKRTLLRNAIFSSATNSAFKLRVSINSEKSILTPRIRTYLDENDAFVIDVVVVGEERIMVTEPIDKEVFNQIVDQNLFVEKAFTNFFGVNVMNMNYHIEILKTSACLISDISKGDCVHTFNLDKNDSSYSVLGQLITSREFSSAFILIDAVVSKEKSRLIQTANDAIIRDADRSEHIRFYFCIPKNNLRPGSGRFFDIDGKVMTLDKKPMIDVNVELRDVNNKVVASRRTDKNGYLKFNNIDEGMSYTLFVDKSIKTDGLKLTSKDDKAFGNFTQTKTGFEYKLQAFEVNSMQAAKIPEPTEETLINIKARVVSVNNKVTPVADQIVELRDMQNKVLQTKITNQDGDFEFSDVNVKEIYSVELYEYKEKFKNEKVYISNSKNELIARINKDGGGKFSYKTIPADMIYLSDMPDEDVTLTVKRQLTNSDKNIVIRDFVFYQNNSAAVSNEAKVVLDRIANIIKQNPGCKVDVISHTDSKGEGEVNLKLSLKRSEAVIDYFIKNGIEKERLIPVGMGESKPLNSCGDGVACTEEELKMNRRTEFKFYKK